MKCLESPEDFYEVYAPQKGGYFRVYKAFYGRQKGAGLGGIFGTIARKLLPFLTQKLLPFARKHVLPFAASAAKNVALDVVKGADLKHSVASNSGHALRGMVDSSLGQSGGGPPRKRSRSTNSLSKTKKAKKRKTSTSPVAKKKKKYKKKKTRDLSFKKSIFD